MKTKSWEYELMEMLLDTNKEALQEILRLCVQASFESEDKHLFFIKKIEGHAGNLLTQNSAAENEFYRHV